MKQHLSIAIVVGSICALAAINGASIAGGKKGDAPADKRLGKAKTLRDYFPFTPPKTLAEWKKRRAFVKAQVRVGNGLFPFPKKTALKPVIHGKIRRDGYTIEKVYFQSYPGFYVTGNLYRPTSVKKGQKAPAVLCPHGHWRNGRFYKAPDGNVKRDRNSGAEDREEGARYPLQARCANLAMLGCVVFHYDMVGYADSKQIPHRQGFTDADAALWLQNFMGLQTWNSIRSLDFLLTLPEVDAKRIAVTGASGGGTQTFLLCAVDNRPAAAFPAVMVSTAMQGGCVGENCSYLRVDTGNIELAGLFAPKPLAMSGANDWTKEIETKGLPQLKQLYDLYNAGVNVNAKAWVQFPHNYNQRAREMMYNWFNQHLKLGHKSKIVERPFVPVPPEQLSVWDDAHKLPEDAKTAASLRDYMRDEARKQLAALFPGNKKTLKRFQTVVGTALRAMMVEPGLPNSREILIGDSSALFKGDGFAEARLSLSRKGTGEKIRAAWLRGKQFNGTIVINVVADPKSYREGAKEIVAKGADVFAVQPFGVGLERKQLGEINKTYHGFTFGYNRSILANRVRDILTAVAHVKSQPGVKKVHLVGVGEAGPWVVLARALCGDAVQRTAADLNRFRFAEILSMSDEMMQPGALRNGDMKAFAALCAPGELFVHNAKGVDNAGWIAAAYRSAGQPKNLRQQVEAAKTEEVVNWLLP